MRRIKFLLGTAFLCAHTCLGNLPVFNVRDFGASGKKTDNATAAIQRAIDSASSNGGGVVLIPKGEYTSLPIRLYSNITFQIDANAVIYVDLKNPEFKGQSYIYAENASNIVITGKGTIDGQATYVYENVRGIEAEIKEEMEIARAAGVEMKRYYRTPGQAAAHILLMRECENLTIENVRLVNSSLWCVRISGCDGVSIRGVNVESSQEKGVNSDGIDIDGSRNVHIYGANIFVGDDAICIKTSVWRKGGNDKVNIAENIVVDNCVLSSSSAALKLGTESHGDMRHIVFSNCVIRNSNKGIEITVKDGAQVSDIIFSNLTMELKRRHWNWWGDGQVFNFVLSKRNDKSRPGSIRNVQIQNVIAHAQGTSRIISQLENPIENFTVSNMKIFMEPESTPDKRTLHGMLFSNVKGLKLKDVEIYWNDETPEPKWKSAVLLDDVEGFELQGLKARQAFSGSTDPAVSINNSSNGIIFNCIAQKGTTTFFKVSGTASSEITFGRNFAANARTPLLLSPEVKRQTIKQEK